MDAYGIPTIMAGPGARELNTPFGLVDYGLPQGTQANPVTLVPPYQSGAPVGGPAPYVGGSSTPRATRNFGPALNALNAMSQAPVSRPLIDQRVVSYGRQAPSVLQFPVPQGDPTVIRPNPKRTPSGGDSGEYPLDRDTLTALMKKNESTNNYQAVNKPVKGKKATTASGAYQYLDWVWNNYGGYSRAMYAPKEVQDRRFREDLEASMRRYNGDPFKSIASHYLPKYANDPGVWRQSLKVQGEMVPSVETYIRKTLKDQPQLQAQFDEYLKRYPAR